jgi:hypothetical protein
MKKVQPFMHRVRGKGRPQIVLIGNGLERSCPPTRLDPKGRKKQLSWNELLDRIKAENCMDLSDDERKKLPFPLLYSLLSVPDPAPATIDTTMIKEEEDRLKEAMRLLSQTSTWRLDALTTLGADHILTTNYSYGLEQAFLSGKDFFNSSTRSYYRFNHTTETKNDKPVREVCYRLHSGYLAHNDNGSEIGLWHIHGECSVSRGVVLGHDRYGRLLSRIEKLCDSQKYADMPDDEEPVAFRSWPTLFLYGDVYIVGLSFALSEFDLWWLLKRKQREQKADGHVFFYEQPNDASLTQKMLRAHGAVLPDVNAKKGDFDDFYRKAFADIAARIESNRLLVVNNDEDK